MQTLKCEHIYHYRHVVTSTCVYMYIYINIFIFKGLVYFRLLLNGLSCLSLSSAEITGMCHTVVYFTRMNYIHS